MSHQPDEGWLGPMAATGQLQLVLESQERGWLTLPPVPPFLEAIEHLLKRNSGMPLTLLDVGCGVGMYAAVCEEHCPGIIYSGCDVSPHMIALAEEHFADPQHTMFFLADATEPDKIGAGIDIVLASALLDVVLDWKEILAALFALDPLWIILNRVRVWNDHAQPTECREYETLYHTWSWAVTHNWPELEALVQEHGGTFVFAKAYQVEPETSLMCYVVEVDND